MDESRVANCTAQQRCSEVEKRVYQALQTCVSDRISRAAILQGRVFGLPDHNNILSLSILITSKGHSKTNAVRENAAVLNSHSIALSNTRAICTGRDTAAST